MPCCYTEPHADIIPHAVDACPHSLCANHLKLLPLGITGERQDEPPLKAMTDDLLRKAATNADTDFILSIGEALERYALAVFMPLDGSRA